MARQPLPPLAAVRAFEAAARHGSFTRAGEELGMTQAAVSYQIRLLEERVGGPLFKRRARGVSLTAEGARLAARAGEAMDILREAFAEARKVSDEVLAISSIASFAILMLAPRLGKFQLGHPGIGVRVDIDHRSVDLLAGEASIGIRAGRGNWPGLRADVLMPSMLTVMMSPRFAAEHGPFEAPADLLRVPRIDPDDPGWGFWFAAAGLSEAPSKGRVLSSLGTQALTVEAARAGQGACLLTPLYFRDALERGELVQPFDILAAEDMSIWLVYPERRHNAPAIRAFRTWLLGEMAALGAGVDTAPDPGAEGAQGA
ncbi:LysR substrate-binding domain-containing protein [Solirhodobacter olei]|uniref:LysR substrate-binding domain-containing protein n=1 Tax=Solirhodobacter olei TaxID=2493082 RepID=UPI000FD8A558|nr:LysR substrate-binding domain-containing protein [Solirhodobacter olei]